jgi:hypothetical protein
MRAISLGAALILLVSFCEAFSQQPNEFIVIEGTITDPHGKSISSGEIHLTFAGGRLTDFRHKFKDGKYEVRVPIAEKDPLPLT